MSPTLIDLPAELLTEICSYLCCHCLVPQSTADRTARGLRTRRRGDQQDLRDLSRACRTSYGAAEPFLYHRVNLIREHHLYLFIRTLLSRPDLRSNVLELKIRYFDSSNSQSRLFSPPSSSMTQRTSVLSPYSTESELGEPVALRQTAEHHTLVSLLMGLVPNMKALELVLPGSGFLQMAPISPSPNLKSLRKLYFASSGPDFLLDRVAPIMRSASDIQSLHCHLCTHVTDTFCISLGRKTLAEPPPLHNLTELILTQTLVPAESLRNLLRVVGPGLSKVEIRWPNVTFSREGEGSEAVRFDEVVSLLRPWHRTLRELLFSLDGSIQAHMQRSQLRNVRFLQGFTALENLQAHGVVFDLYGHEGPPDEALVSTLPPQVRELRLFGFGDLYAALRGLLEAVGAGQFTCLRRIGIDDQAIVGWEASEVLVERLREVAASFRSGGVDFLVHS